MSKPVYPSDEWQLAEMRRIADLIWGWKRAYYYGQPTVDDQTYDLWWKNLLYMEARYPHLMDPNSPTVAVGSPAEWATGATTGDSPA